MKWNYHAHGEESVAACPQSKDDIKTTKMTWPMLKNRGVKTGGHVCTKFILLFSLALAKSHVKTSSLCTPTWRVIQLESGQNNGQCVLSGWHTLRIHVYCIIIFRFAIFCCRMWWKFQKSFDLSKLKRKGIKNWNIMFPSYILCCSIVCFVLSIK